METTERLKNALAALETIRDLAREAISEVEAGKLTPFAALIAIAESANMASLKYDPSKANELAGLQEWGKTIAEKLRLTEKADKWLAEQEQS